MLHFCVVRIVLCTDKTTYQYMKGTNATHLNNDKHIIGYYSRHLATGFLKLFSPIQSIRNIHSIQTCIHQSPFMALKKKEVNYFATPQIQ